MWHTYELLARDVIRDRQREAAATALGRRATRDATARDGGAGRRTPGVESRRGPATGTGRDPARRRGAERGSRGRDSPDGSARRGPSGAAGRVGPRERVAPPDGVCRLGPFRPPLPRGGQVDDVGLDIEPVVVGGCARSQLRRAPHRDAEAHRRPA